MSKVAVVLCWQPGTEEMVNVCLSSLARHTPPELYEVLLVSAAQDNPSYRFLGNLSEFPVELLEPINLTPPEGKESSRLHGWMLDEIIPARLDQDNEFVLTLDSDCFPIADGWLEDLLEKLQSAMLSGILHPWAPPPEDLPRNKVEYRVRSQHCWLNTHVACQLVRVKDYRYLHGKGCRFNAGDDTGLLIPKMVLAEGGKIDGFKVSRCPIVWEGDLDPEFNRYSCLVYGDKMYHHGGFSRSKVQKDDPVFGKSFSWCEDLVLWGRGAEFLLNDRFGYQFKLDREEEVAKEKMQRLFGLRGQRMPG
jgi:hypothetical protein